MTEVAASPHNRGTLPSIRSLGRVDDWWYSKVALVLAVSYCAALLYGVGAWATARTIGTIALVGLCAGSYGHLVNDVFDLEVDARAGKRNHMARFSQWQRFALCAAAIVLGFLPGVFRGWSRTSFLLLAFEYLLPTIYSVPPLRLKGRGALGLVCDGFGAHLVPCLYVISLMAHEGGVAMRLHAGFVGLIAVWALCLGLKGIVIHEFEDRENDLRSGIDTFATGASFESVRRPVTAVFWVELVSFAGVSMALARSAPLVPTLAMIYAAVAVLRVRVYWEHYRRIDEQATSIEWWQLSHPFYEAYFPLAAAIACAWRHPGLAVFPALQLAVFAASFKKQLPALADAWTLISLGGRLALSDGASARVSTVLWPWPARRIEVGEAGIEGWQIRVVRPGVRIRAGRAYQMTARIRSDQARKVLFGVWQDHAPWSAVGRCEAIELSPKWQTVRLAFRAVEEERRACLSLWLGGESGAVELGWWGIRRIFERKR